MKITMALLAWGVGSAAWAQTPAPEPSPEPFPAPVAEPAPEPTRVYTLSSSDGIAFPTRSGSETNVYDLFGSNNQTDPDLILVAEALEELLSQKLSESTGQSTGRRVNTRLFGGFGVSASRIDGYGVIFTVSQTSILYYSNGSLAGQEDAMAETFKEFLVNYGDLIDDLDDQDQITIVAKTSNNTNISNQLASGNSNYVIVSNSGQNDVSLRVSVSKKDLRKLYGGTTPEEFMERYITVEKQDPMEMRGRNEMEIFANLMRKRFSPSNDGSSFAALQSPSFEYIPDLGVVFHLNLSNLGRSSLMPLFITTERISREFSEDLAEAVEEELEDNMGAAMQAYGEQYDNFQEELREFILKYGRTIRFLDDMERIIVKVHVPSCRECTEEFPDRYEVEVFKFIVNNFASGKLDHDEAISQVEVK